MLVVTINRIMVACSTNIKVPYCNFEVCICNESLTDVLRVLVYCGCKVNWARLIIYQGSAFLVALCNYSLYYQSKPAHTRPIHSTSCGQVLRKTECEA